MNQLLASGDAVPRCSVGRRQRGQRENKNSDTPLAMNRYYSGVRRRGRIRSFDHRGVIRQLRRRSAAER